MNSENTLNPGRNAEENKGSLPEKNAEGGEDAEVISLPHTDRPEGPFPHSGETAGRTEAEEKEAEDAQEAH